jgi:hypothetical protein
MQNSLLGVSEKVAPEGKFYGAKQTFSRLKADLQ